MAARHHQHEAIAAERIGGEPARIDGPGNDADIADALAMRPTISSLSRSSRSTLTFGCAVRTAQGLGQEFGQRVVLDSTRTWPQSAGIGAQILTQPFGLLQHGAGVLHQRPPAGVGVSPAGADQERSAQRLLHVADASRSRSQRQMARSAPRVMLPASTTWRNRLKSVRSKRWLSFVFGEGDF